MYIEQLNNDDYGLLSFLLTKNYDTTQTITKFNNNTVKLSVLEYGEKERYVFYIQDFRIVPASNLAAENYLLLNIEDSFYKFMKLKFGYAYECELNSYKKSEWIETTNSLNQ